MNNAYDIEQAFAAIEEELIASMMRNMKRHRDWEDAEGFQWAMWQAEQLKALEKYKKKNRKKFQKKFNEINGSIRRIIEMARKQGGMDQELAILEAIKNGWKPPKQFSGAATTAAEFFKLNTRKLEALIKATEKDFEKAEVAMLRMADDQYRQVIFNAQVYANTGAATYEKAVDMATKDFLSRGINCIEYANGARHTIQDYAEMAIRTAAKRAYLAGEGEKRQEWGISTVIVNKRGNPCPKCLPFVGKILIDDVWSGGKPEDGPYPLMSSAVAAGLYHPRCKDAHSTYFPGISDIPDDKFTNSEIEEIESNYTLEQKRNIAQRNYEKYSRLAENALDDENKEKYRQKANFWQQEYNKYYNLGTITQQDIEQYYKYKAIFGDEIPDSIEKFKDLKYNNTKEWNRIKAEKQERINAMGYRDMQALVHKLGDKEVRLWYVAQDKKIPNMIDKTLPLEEQARQACDLRNQNRTNARELMKNQEERRRLDKTDPNKSFEELILSKMQRKNMTRDEAIKDIIKTATKTRKSVNEKYGLGE